MTLLDTDERITVDEFLHMPDNAVLELVDGCLVEKSVSAESSRVEMWIGSVFNWYIKSHPVAKVYNATLAYRCFPDDLDRIRRPDVCVIRVERLVGLNDPDPRIMPIPPDLAIEVVSPNDRVRELTLKTREYLEAGFPLVWVVDPEAQIVTVHSRDDRPRLLTAHDEITAEAALPGFRCRVGELFPQR